MRYSARTHRPSDRHRRQLVMSRASHPVVQRPSAPAEIERTEYTVTTVLVRGPPAHHPRLDRGQKSWRVEAPSQSTPAARAVPTTLRAPLGRRECRAL